MKLKDAYVADFENNGLLDTVTRMHVMSVSFVKEGKRKIETFTTKKAVKKLFENPGNIIVGHNFYLYDIPAIEKIYNIKVKARIIDSLLVAQYIDPIREKKGKKYGLASFGEDFGIPKPDIKDEEWIGIGTENEKKLEQNKDNKNPGADILTLRKKKKEHIELMTNRCVEDVKINTNIWVSQLKYLNKLYDNDTNKINFLLNFLMTKGRQYKMHQDNPLKIDLQRAEKYKKELQNKKDEIINKLKPYMPVVKKYSKRTRPKKCFNKDGEPSKLGQQWFEKLEKLGLNSDYKGEIEVLTSTEEPNPNSPDQIKDWLFSLGWKPAFYKDTVLKDGTENKVPQVKIDGKLCDSVKILKKKVPQIQYYEDLGVITHRMGLVKGMIRDSDTEGNIFADMAGLTNTLRIRHRKLVNLPKPDKPYGKYVRSLIIPQKGYKLFGSDLSSLENITRNNFIYPYDPQYVEESRGEYYDSHLDIAVIAGMIDKKQALFYKYKKEKDKNPKITPEDIDKVPKGFYDYLRSIKDKDKLFKELDEIRSSAKTTNYSALYGVGAPKLSKTTGKSVDQCTKLLRSFWDRNWAVTKFAENCEVKTINKQKWVKNPLNGLYYFLKSSKDVFSTVNQGCGDYIFTLWVHFLMELGITVQAGFHDEFVSSIKNDEEFVIKKTKEAIEKVNDLLKLEIPVNIDYKIGDNYAQVH